MFLYCRNLKLNDNKTVGTKRINLINNDYMLNVFTVFESSTTFDKIVRIMEGFHVYKYVKNSSKFDSLRIQPGSKFKLYNLWF